ncbi:MAG: ATP-dependent DNA helicase RecG [Spirochaetes bacterium]|nr:ATP-dependent DNA helicase RecG [Spirochaetota bacterium]
MIFSELTTPLTSLKGVGKKLESSFSKLGITNIAQLLRYFPRTYSDRRNPVSLAAAVKKQESVTVKAKVIEHRLIGKNRYRQFLKILIHDGLSYGALLCFNRNFLSKQLIPGEVYFITGKFFFQYNEIQCSSFEFESIATETISRIIPIYSLTEGLLQKHLRLAVQQALTKYIPELEDDLPSAVCQANQLIPLKAAFQQIHFPEEYKEYYSAKKRLVYQEFFYQKLFLLAEKEKRARITKERKRVDNHLVDTALQSLPFTLTSYQQEAIAKIKNALFSDEPVSLLLQGDVGSGKTIVALLSALEVIATGEQCVFMAPTEVLAIQHYKTIKKMVKNLKLDIALLTGSLNKRERDNILQGLFSGEIKLVIGTHAVFSQDVEYHKLGLAIIDEQHRFGVEQRLKLQSKGNAVDQLLMTATPIPQSLALTLYGDLDLIMMKGRIQGRQEVKTWLIDDDTDRVEKMHTWIKETIKKEEGRVIFVYPLIDPSDKLAYKDLVSQYEKLSLLYQEIGSAFIHSRLSSEEKEKILDDFRSGTIRMIAATTVVEVGMDIPDANVIVIENADNYGLATLHQLRGRVGRNNKQGYMVLIANMDNISEEGKKRLELIKNQTDGFAIAEADLFMRGPGDYVGSRQSGLLNIKLANINKDLALLKKATIDATEFMQQDSGFNQPQHYLLKKSFIHKIREFKEHQ